MMSPTEAARQVLRTLFLEWKLCIPRLLMSSCNEHLRAGSRCWMIIAILRPVDHKRRVELEREREETHLRDSRTDYYDKSRVVSRIHNGNELVLELVMNLNQVQEGHVFSITQRSTAMSNWARVVYTIIHVQSRRQECCFYDDAPTTYYPACCPICDIATNNVNPFWTAVDASPSWPHLHFCPFPQSSASSACRVEKTDVIHTSGSNLGEGGSHLIVIWLLFICETFLQIFFKIFMRLQSQIVFSNRCISNWFGQMLIKLFLGTVLFRNEFHMLGPLCMYVPIHAPHGRARLSWVFSWPA